MDNERPQSDQQHITVVHGSTGPPGAESQTSNHSRSHHIHVQNDNSRHEPPRHIYIPPTSSISGDSRSERPYSRTPPYGSGAAYVYPGTPWAQPPVIPPPTQPPFISQAQTYGAHISYSPPYAHGTQIPYGSQTPYAHSFQAPYYVTGTPVYAQEGLSPIEQDLDNTEQASTYVAVDPFRRSRTSSIMSTSLPSAYNYGTHAHTSPYVIYPYSSRRSVVKGLLIDAFSGVSAFIFSTLPRQFYLHFLLRLPSFYFSRVARIFEEANMTMPEIKKMALANVHQGMNTVAFQQWSSSLSTPDLKLKTTWEGFIDSLLREWKTLNIVSALLLSAILTILQIEGAATDPITRNCALFSLICALMSLLYGCMYIIRFGTMRKTYKAAEWAQEAQKTRTLIWWNVWVLLAMPAVWLAWSIILYITCIMAFVWRSGTTGNDKNLLLSSRAERDIRIAISSVLALGVIYFALILNTLRQYGDAMDKSFRARIEAWAAERHRPYYNGPPPIVTVLPAYSDRSSTGPSQESTSYSSPPIPVYVPLPPHPGSINSSLSSTLFLFGSIKVMDLRFQNRGGYPMPDFLLQRGFTHEDWERFISRESRAWDGDTPLHRLGRSWKAPLRPQDSVVRLLKEWNKNYFNPRHTMALLCQEYSSLFPNSPMFSIYLLDLTSLDGMPFKLVDRFGPVPDGLDRIDIFDQSEQESSRRRWILGRTSIFSTRNPMEGRVHFGTGWGEPSRRRSRSYSPSTRTYRSDNRAHLNDTPAVVIQPHSSRSRFRSHSNPLDTESSLIDTRPHPHRASISIPRDRPTLGTTISTTEEPHVGIPLAGRRKRRHSSRSYDSDSEVSTRRTNPSLPAPQPQVPIPPSWAADRPRNDGQQYPPSTPSSTPSFRSFPTERSRSYSPGYEPVEERRPIPIRRPQNQADATEDNVQPTTYPMLHTIDSYEYSSDQRVTGPGHNRNSRPRQIAHSQSHDRNSSRLPLMTPNTASLDRLSGLSGLNTPWRRSLSQGTGELAADASTTPLISYSQVADGLQARNYSSLSRHHNSQQRDPDASTYPVTIEGPWTRDQLSLIALAKSIH